MPKLLVAQGGGVCRNFVGSGGDMRGRFGAQEGVCRNFWWLRGGGVCRNFCVLKGGYEGTFWGSGGGMPDLLWA